MSNPSSAPQESEEKTSEPITPPTSNEAQASYVKLAMRNMVRKRGTSVKHFVLTTISLLAVLITLSYLTR